MPPTDFTLTAYILPQISQICTELLAEFVLPQISQICTELLAECILPQISQNSQKLGCLQGGALVSARLCRLPEQEVHQPSKKTD